MQRMLHTEQHVHSQLSINKMRQGGSHEVLTYAHWCKCVKERTHSSGHTYVPQATGFSFQVAKKTGPNNLTKQSLFPLTRLSCPSAGQPPRNAPHPSSPQPSTPPYRPPRTSILLHTTSKLGAKCTHHTLLCKSCITLGSALFQPRSCPCICVCMYASLDLAAMLSWQPYKKIFLASTRHTHKQQPTSRSRNRHAGVLLLLLLLL